MMLHGELNALAATQFSSKRRRSRLLMQLPQRVDLQEPQMQQQGDIYVLTTDTHMPSHDAS
jgi:hypothetical protein